MQDKIRDPIISISRICNCICISKVILTNKKPVLSATTWYKRGKTRHEEVETGEGDHVDRQLPEVSIELAGEPEAGRHAGHGEGHQVVEVTVGGGHQLQSSVI